MGDNNLNKISAGNTGFINQVNQFVEALSVNFLPRTIAGVVLHEAGSLGDSTRKWLRAHISSGYWNIGDIKPHHSYNNVAPPGQGWFLCDGSIINEANYEAQSWASVGDWDKYVISSALDGLYSPNLVGRYATGAATTPQTGAGAITSVGNASNQVNLQHNHPHNHFWYNAATPNAKSWNSSGTIQNITSITTLPLNHGIEFRAGGSDDMLDQDLYTDNDSTNGGSTTQSIRPDSIEVQYYVRII